MQKNTPKRRLLCAVLALFLFTVAALSTACGKKDEPQDTTVPTEEGDNPLATVPSADFDRDFTILSANYCKGWSTLNVNYEDVTGDPIAETIYKRTLAFEEKYNTTVYTTGVDPESVYQGMYSVSMTGDPAYDLVLPHPTQGLATMMLNGWFADLNSISSIDLSGEWYNQSQIENYMSNNKLYIATSDMIVTGQSFIALVYNRNLMETYLFEESVQSLVEDKKWTVEKLSEMIAVTEFGGDNSDGSQTYGLAFNSASIGRWMYAMGESILVKAEDGSYSAGCSNGKMTDIAQKMNTLLNTHGSTVLVSKAYSLQLADSEIWKAFSGGKALFLTWDVGGCYNYLRDLTFDIGYAPLPMYDTNQGDYYINCAAGLFAIPAVAYDQWESGLAFEYMSRYSNVYLKTAFYERILGGRLSDYPEDYRMLDFLHSKKTWDFGYTLDEDADFLDCLMVPVVENHAPGAVALHLAQKRNIMQKIVDAANGIN